MQSMARLLCPSLLQFILRLHLLSSFQKPWPPPHHRPTERWEEERTSSMENQSNGRSAIASIRNVGNMCTYGKEISMDQAGWLAGWSAGQCSRFTCQNFYYQCEFIAQSLSFLAGVLLCNPPHSWQLIPPGKNHYLIMIMMANSNRRRLR